MKPSTDAKPPRALDALRARTRAAHARVEAALRIAAPAAGRAEYARHVAALEAWTRPNEPALWGAPWPDRIEAPRRARKAAWLARDVAVARAAGCDVPRIAPAPAVALDDPAARFGRAYVVEGSMLGGAALLARLGPRLSPWPARYLRGYGADQPRLWRAFLDALDAEVADPGAVERAAGAALGAFDELGAWLAEHGA